MRQRLSRHHEIGSMAADYKYNICDWITSTGNPSFYQTFHYADGIGAPCYNGKSVV